MTAATADRAYAIGASENSVAICTPARAVADNANTPYTRIRIRPGPWQVASASVMSDGPDLVHAQLHDRDHEARERQRARTPPAALRQRPQRTQRQNDQPADQVPDEEHPGHVPLRACQLDDAHNQLRKQSHL